MMVSQAISTRLFYRATLTVAASLALAACATKPTDISRIPTQISQETSKEGVFTQPVKWERAKPGCKGECPTIKVDSLVFPGNPQLTDMVDHGLAYMTGVGENTSPPYGTIAEYEAYFWKTAASRDSTVLIAKSRYRNRSLTVVELDTWQYMTGMAHGLSATRFLNWDNTAERLLSLDDVLKPGKKATYVAALKEAHARWLARDPYAQEDPAAYSRMWPFQESDNFGFTDQGLVVKYNSYEIAPYSAGQLELLIPYSALANVLKPAFLPA